VLVEAALLFGMPCRAQDVKGVAPVAKDIAPGALPIEEAIYTERVLNDLDRPVPQVQSYPIQSKRLVQRSLSRAANTVHAT